MSEPRDFKAAIRQFETFHALPPKEMGTFVGLEIPDTCAIVGEATNILYRSDKWEGRNHDYTHEHGRGVRVARFDMRGDAHTPALLTRVTSLYRLGVCLGLYFSTPDGEPVEAKVGRPYPELYAIPSGKALLIIDTVGTRAKLRIALWGGKLHVKDVGIVG